MVQLLQNVTSFNDSFMRRIKSYSGSLMSLLNQWKHRDLQQVSLIWSGSCTTQSGFAKEAYKSCLGQTHRSPSSLFLPLVQSVRCYSSTMSAMPDIEYLKGVIMFERILTTSRGISSLPSFPSSWVGADTFAPVAAASLFVYDSFLLLSMEVSSLAFSRRKRQSWSMVSG